jgi:D-alanine-D-alanine ligase
MKKLRILVPMHITLVPPDTLDGYSDKEIAEWKTEYDVVQTLRELGHEVRPLGLIDDLTELRKAISDWKPHVAFNLLEEFHSVPTYDQHVVSYL